MTDSQHTVKSHRTAADCSGYIGMDRARAVTVTPYRPAAPTTSEAPPRTSRD